METQEKEYVITSSEKRKMVRLRTAIWRQAACIQAVKNAGTCGKRKLYA